MAGGSDRSDPSVMRLRMLENDYIIFWSFNSFSKFLLLKLTSFEYLELISLLLCS